MLARFVVDATGLGLGDEKGHMQFKQAWSYQLPDQANSSVCAPC